MFTAAEIDIPTELQNSSNRFFVSSSIRTLTTAIAYSSAKEPKKFFTM